MAKAILQKSHEEYWLDQGWLLALGFYEGWVCFRIKHREWSRLKPFSLGTVATVSNLTAYNEIIDSQSRHYLEPHSNDLIYHTFWGVTPTRARIYTQYPPRADLGSMLAVERSETGDIGYIDGEDSPYNGPFSLDTELFTVKEKYPAFQVYNPLPDSMYNVMLNFAQRHYTYTIIKNKAVIRDILIGYRRVKKYTMGGAWPNATTVPQWLQDLVGDVLLKYSLDVIEEGGA